MNWALEHIQILLAAAAIIAAWAKKMRANSERRAQQSRQTTLSPQTISQPAENDTDVAQRTRRIQEEIRRKIEERSRLGRTTRAPVPPALPTFAPQASTPAPAEADPFSARELERGNPIAMPRPEEPARGSLPLLDLSARARADTLARAAARERVRALDREERARPREDTISIQLAPIALIPATENLFPAHSLRATLSDTDEVRRAIVLSEILRPPVGLR